MLLIIFFTFNTFIAYYEEPTLKQKFGATYARVLSTGSTLAAAALTKASAKSY